jgi:hypothetical protein
MLPGVSSAVTPDAVGGALGGALGGAVGGAVGGANVMTQPSP